MRVSLKLSGDKQDQFQGSKTMQGTVIFRIDFITFFKRIIELIIADLPWSLNLCSGPLALE